MKCFTVYFLDGDRGLCSVETSVCENVVTAVTEALHAKPWIHASDIVAVVTTEVRLDSDALARLENVC